MNKDFFKINHKINLLDILDILDISKDDLFLKKITLLFIQKKFILKILFHLKI